MKLIMLLEGGEKGNNNSSPPVHADIREYQSQNMNVDKLNDDRRKRKNPLYGTNKS